MVNITLSISDVLYKKMAKHREFNWSEVARQAIAEKVEDSELIADMKAIAKGQDEYKRGKTISHKELVKRLGLENEL